MPNGAGGGSTEITCDGDAHLFVDDTINNAKLVSFCQWDVVCKAAGGVWDAATNRCTPGVTQVGCEAGGGTWDAGTSTCTAASNYNCFVGGLCSQATIVFPPSDNGYTNAYDGHTPDTEPASGAGCNVAPGTPYWGAGQDIVKYELSSSALFQAFLLQSSSNPCENR